MRRWHTVLEFLTHDDLMRELRSGDRNRFIAACEELKCRPFTDAHWAMYAAAALDPAVPEDHRRYLPYMLFHGDDRLRYEVQKSLRSRRPRTPTRAFA